MDYQRDSNGWQTFLEHWGFTFIVLLGLLGMQVQAFFILLSGAPWIWCYALSLVAGAIGVGLLFYAKLPLYRERRFFTFGSRALPEKRRPFYRWGYRCAVCAIVVLACLLLSE